MLRRALRASPLMSCVAVASLCAAGLGCTQPRPVTAVPVAAHTPPVEPSRHIRVDGIATVQVSPDVVDLVITLSTKQERPKLAVAELARMRDSLLAALQGAGIASGQLRLGHVDVSPAYRPRPENHLIDGYEASIRLAVTLAKFERIGELMDIAASHGAGRMHTRFRSTRMAQAKLQARELALAAARAKAEQMARLMNVMVGDVRSIEEIQREAPMFGPESNVMAPRPAPVDPQAVQPGALPLTLTVQVTFELVARYGGYPAYRPSRP